MNRQPSDRLTRAILNARIDWDNAARLLANYDVAGGNTDAGYDRLRATRDRAKRRYLALSRKAVAA